MEVHARHSRDAAVASLAKEALMAHLASRPGGPIVAPFGVGVARRRGRDTPGWKARSSRETPAIVRVPVMAALLAATVLAGCANLVPVPTTVVAAGMPNPEEALQQSMRHVDAEMAELGTFRAPPRAAPVVPEDLRRVVSLAWSGSLDKGVASLAQAIGYTFYTTAAPDTPPLDVAVRIEAAPAFEVFRALGDQAGARATVEVDPLRHLVQVIHHA
jgi:defect-in-organelle-trafficking protein DotD